MRRISVSPDFRAAGLGRVGVNPDLRMGGFVCLQSGAKVDFVEG